MDLCLVPTGKEKEEEVISIHPRAMFIPQQGWTFLAAGKTISNVKTSFLRSSIQHSPFIRYNAMRLRLFVFPLNKCFPLFSSFFNI